MARHFGALQRWLMSAAAMSRSGAVWARTLASAAATARETESMSPKPDILKGNDAEPGPQLTRVGLHQRQSSSVGWHDQPASNGFLKQALRQPG